MQIQWFPGHMHKAQKEVREIFPLVDMVIEVLDARIPYSSQNPLIAELRQDKPTLKIFSKSDMADPELTKLWQAEMEKTHNIKTLALSTQQADRKNQVLSQIKKMVPNRGDSTRIIHVLIMGIPNVGKSTLINALAGRHIAKTGNEPAVTKMQQRIKLEDNITLIDTPGMLWPNIENPLSGFRLAATGGIKETAFELPDIASYLAEYFLSAYPEQMKTRYGFTELPQNDIDFLESIGRNRGCLRSGGMVDLDKIARIFINEYRTTMIGGITLETPDMMHQELAQVELARIEKAAKKQARLDARKQKNNKRNRGLSE
ncbi:MAG: ribosome biogenesis GTPase YlqF [Thiotrichales bacterium]|nr:ribosome biogenesis GTPase YlqF [Thiotrichales bacterium]